MFSITYIYFFKASRQGLNDKYLTKILIVCTKYTILKFYRINEEERFIAFILMTCVNEKIPYL